MPGQDAYTGDNYDYRRDWIEKLLEYQAGVFAVDVGNHSVLSNHLHLIARTRPDIAARWSDEEIELLLRNAHKLAYARQGLSNLSWFLARCKEPIARLANTQMNRAGHFLEQRFGCREIVDEQALLTCMVYVDVNQIKAGMAETLEDSRTSAIAARMAAWQAREARASLEEFHSSRGGGYELSPEQIRSPRGTHCLDRPIPSLIPCRLASPLRALPWSPAAQRTAVCATRPAARTLPRVTAHPTLPPRRPARRATPATGVCFVTADVAVERLTIRFWICRCQTMCGFCCGSWRSPRRHERHRTRTHRNWYST